MCVAIGIATSQNNEKPSSGSRIKSKSYLANIMILYHGLTGPPRPHNLTVVLSTRNADPVYGNPHLNVVLQWSRIDQTFSATLNLNYTITISPDPPSADSMTIFHTTNVSIQLNLLYDQDYNISVVARSCIGTSAPAEIHIRIIQCDNFTLILRKDDVLRATMIYCPSSVTTTTTVTDEVMVSRFSNESILLDLATQQHGSSMNIARQV
jgi:hypothetical protein